jgi:CheY-like chemotaxis protein
MSALVVWGPGGERRTLLDALRQLGVEDVEIVDAAIPAFARLAVKRPSIVFVDLAIRPVSGVTFTREVRANPIANRDAPIILYLKADAEARAEDAAAAGVDGVLVGAFDVEDVREALTMAQGLGPRTPGAMRVFGRGARQGDALSAIAVSAANAAYGRIERLAAEAKSCVAAWSRNGAEAELALALMHLNEAAQVALRFEDAKVLRCINRAVSVIDDTRRSWDADDRAIIAAIDEAMAAMAPPQDTPHISGLSKVS